MLRNFVNALLAFMLIVVLFVGGYWLGQSPYAPVQLYYPAGNTPSEIETTSSPFWEAWQLVHTRYYELPVDDVTLTDGAIDGMMSSLGDDYTRYLPPADEEAAALDAICDRQVDDPMLRFGDANPGVDPSVRYRLKLILAERYTSTAWSFGRHSSSSWATGSSIRSRRTRLGY